MSRTVREEVLGEAARLVTGVEQLAESDERAGDVLVGDRAEDREAALERGAAEELSDLLDVERAVGDRLVEQRQRVAHRAGTGAGDDREGLGRRPRRLPSRTRRRDAPASSSTV